VADDPDAPAIDLRSRLQECEPGAGVGDEIVGRQLLDAGRAERRLPCPSIVEAEGSDAAAGEVVASTSIILWPRNG